MIRVLVVYGSKRGGTAWIADIVGDALRSAGLDVDVEAAGHARRLARRPESYDAVVVGGALYASKWHRAARRFVKRNARELAGRPVWLFSSGPLDDSADSGDLPPVPGVAALIEKVHARAHVTFGGRLAADAKGFPASAMARNRAGDWRNEAVIRAWARGVAGVLRESAPAA